MSLREHWYCWYKLFLRDFEARVSKWWRFYKNMTKRVSDQYKILFVDKYDNINYIFSDWQIIESSESNT